MKKQPSFAGFTLIELLVGIVIIGILSALLLTVLTRAKNNADRAQCANNLHQWGIALNTFADDNENYFPDNRTGASVSWCGTNVQAFWEKYLIPLSRTPEDVNRRAHVLFCPTEKWHRGADLLPADTNGYGTQLASGYFYLPYRDASSDEYIAHHANINDATRPWIEKQKLGGPFSKAPVAMDEKQSVEGISGNSTTQKWFGTYGLGSNPTDQIPFSSHARSSGEPFGGNFLFEDGRVNWFKSPQISPALTWDKVSLYFKISDI